MFLNRIIVNRFQLNIGIPDENGCWPWLGSRNCYPKDYGRFNINGKKELAHRVAWIIVNGPIPDLFEGLPSMICHLCDCPWCVNPAHLFLGNNKINQKDCIDKRRHRNLNQKGENNLNSKAIEAQVIEVRWDLKKGILTQGQIAEKFGLSRKIVSDINIGKTWGCVAKKEICNVAP